jgi:hypothetical protein
MPASRARHPVGLRATLRVSTDPLGGPTRMEAVSPGRNFAANIHRKEPS